MDSRQRFIIRRCFEKGYPIKAAVELSDCSWDDVKTLYGRFEVDQLRKYDRFISKVVKTAE